MIDYHVHTLFSGDSTATISEQLEAAARLGLEEICFTDHVDFDNPGANFAPANLASRRYMLREYGGSYEGVRIREGAEISMAPFDECAAKTKAYLADFDADFIIGSLHVVDGVDVYYPDYHRNKTQQTAYLKYVETILESLPRFDFISVLGHYDFVAKFAPYEDRRMRLDLSPLIRHAFTGVFKTLVSMGKGIEINTSAWRGEARWGLDVLKLYRALGGEFVTFGSDAHRSAVLGSRLDEAYELALEAGIPYYATFEKMQPTFRPIV
ncbi:MAG: histidinol-phosphatase HisJ family protein [Clostridia bacterium]|nr:histidinol-phosphatase HisJ family protein [Clostridia bacterium]